MTDQSSVTRVAKTHSFLRHVSDKDVDKTLELLSPDVHYRVVGNHALAGVFAGRDAVAAHLVAIAQQTEGHFDPFKQEDVMVGVNYVSVLVDIRMQSTRSVIRTRILFLLHFTADDFIDFVTVFFEDLAAVERFYNRSLLGSP